MSNWSQIALEGWIREVLKVQTKDGVVALPDGREAAVCLRGESVVLVAYDDEETVLAKVRLVPA
jgi:hypothetical protein